MANLIQITDPGKVNDRWFLHCQQYTYEDTSFREVDVYDYKGQITQKWMDTFRVVIDDVDYYIPTNMATEVDNVLTEEEQYVEKTYYSDAVTDELTEGGSTDYVKGAKDYLGIDIAAKDRSDQADYEGEEYWDNVHNTGEPPVTRGEEVSE